MAVSTFFIWTSNNREHAMALKFEDRDGVTFNTTVGAKQRAVQLSMADEANAEDGFLPFTTTLKEMVKRALASGDYFCVHLVNPNQICEGARVVDVTEDGFYISFGFNGLITWDKSLIRRG